MPNMISTMPTPGLLLTANRFPSGSQRSFASNMNASFRPHQYSNINVSPSQFRPNTTYQGALYPHQRPQLINQVPIAQFSIPQNTIPRVQINPRPAHLNNNLQPFRAPALASHNPANQSFLQMSFNPNNNQISRSS